MGLLLAALTFLASLLTAAMEAKSPPQPRARSVVPTTPSGALPVPDADLQGLAPVSRAALPRDMLLGAASAAYQCEGGNAGSDFWRFEGEKGYERSGEAAGSWTRFGEDLACLRELGVNAYRLSLEWGRILPAPDRPDEAAIARYREMLTSLRRAGIRPVVTLHHFTNPAWLREAHPRGWLDPDAALRFRDYARLCAERFGDLVDDWLTFNELNVYLFHAYVTGRFPPGHAALLAPTSRAWLPAARTLLRAHREAYRALHESDRSSANGDGARARVGIVLNYALVLPKDERDPSHVAAARRWDRFFHTSLLDAAQHGALDEDLDGHAEARLDDLDHPTLDLVGVNYYTRIFVQPLPLGMDPVRAFPGYSEMGMDPLGARVWKALAARTGDGELDEWRREIHPEGLRHVSRAVYERTGLPIWITENGLPDAVDGLRARYIVRHLHELQRAVAEGIPVRAYLYWSLTDNYEWGSFEPRCGLYRVECASGDLTRRPTRGARVYARFLRGETVP